MPAGRRAAISIASSLRSQLHNDVSSRGLVTSGPLAAAGPYASKLETLAATGPYASKLKQRGVTRFDGPDVVSFLQGLVTNDVSKFEGEPSEWTPIPSELTSIPNSMYASVLYYPPLYAAMLNAKGRFLYDLFLYKPNVEKREDAPALLADVDAGVADEVVAYLRKHILRKKVEAHDISETLAVWQYYGGKLAKQPDSPPEAEAESIGWGAGKDEFAMSVALANGEQWRWYKDPRLSILGLRGLFSQRTPPPLVESDTEVEEIYYLLWRLEQGVAERSVEIPKEEAMPLEYNLEALNAIDFDKGCYVGQELVARTHHRGVIRKRLMPLHFLQPNGEEAQDAVAPGAEVIDKGTRKKVGKVTTVLGPRGLG